MKRLFLCLFRQPINDQRTISPDLDLLMVSINVEVFELALVDDLSILEDEKHRNRTDR